MGIGSSDVKPFTFYDTFGSPSVVDSRWYSRPPVLSLVFTDDNPAPEWFNERAIPERWAIEYGSPRPATNPTLPWCFADIEFANGRRLKVEGPLKCSPGGMLITMWVMAMQSVVPE